MNANNFSKGDKVVIHTREGKMLNGIYSHLCPNGKGYVKAEDGKSYEREFKSIKKVGNAVTSFDLNSHNAQIFNELHNPSNPNVNIDNFTITPPQSPEWDINKKFEFLAQLTRMVINETSVSLVITGEGGLGKSYTVKKELLIKGLAKEHDYVIIKGFSTPRGLYRTLYENNGKLIIFDDCDEVLDDKIAKNLLKGALDSYDEREISWITQTFNQDLPDSFVFTGRVIFISNKSQNSIDQAILSRSMSIDLTMSAEDKLFRMEFIAKNSKDFMNEYPQNYKEESLALIKENLHSIREFSLRSLEKVVKIRAGQDEKSYDEDGQVIEIDWKDLARFMLLN